MVAAPVAETQRQADVQVDWPLLTGVEEEQTTLSQGLVRRAPAAAWTAELGLPSNAAVLRV